jgi:hypothetical protein
LKCRELLDTDIGVAPAYNTRIRNDINIPVFKPSTMPTIFFDYPQFTSKTREMTFQVLNRTVRTKNKAYKSQMRLDPNCDTAILSKQ